MEVDPKSSSPQKPEEQKQEVLEEDDAGFAHGKPGKPKKNKNKGLEDRSKKTFLKNQNSETHKRAREEFQTSLRKKQKYAQSP